MNIHEYANYLLLLNYDDNVWSSKIKDKLSISFKIYIVQKIRYDFFFFQFLAKKKKDLINIHKYAN